MSDAQQNVPAPITFATPWVGTVLTVLSGLAFAFLCMVLPLVGKASRVVTYYDQNRSAFMTVLSISLLLASLAAASKMARRKLDGSPRPLASFLLIGIDLLLFVALFLGLLEI